MSSFILQVVWLSSTILLLFFYLFCLAEENDVFVDISPKRSIMSRRKSIIKEPGGRKSHGKVVTFGSLPTELTVRSAKDCLKHMYSVKSIY